MHVHPAEHQDVGPAVLVEVVNVRIHAIGLALRSILGRRGEKLVAAAEARSLVPVRSGDDVEHAVPVEVAGVDPIAIIRARQDLADEGRLLSPRR